MFDLLPTRMDLEPDLLNQDKTQFRTMELIWVSHFLTSPYYTNQNKEEIWELINGGRKKLKKEELETRF